MLVSVCQRWEQGTSESQSTSLVHSFTGATTDGDEPNSLIEAQDGNYYGTTALGGNAGSCTDSNNKAVGCGTIFRLSSGSVTVLYSFSGGADGGSPAGLIQGPDGNLYGTTSFGGSSQGNGNCLAGTVETGCGTIFEISPSSPPASGKLTPIYNFSGGSDGAYPNPLIMGVGSVLYGSALVCSQCKTSFAYGVLFSFSPAAPVQSLPRSFPHLVLPKDRMDRASRIQMAWCKQRRKPCMAQHSSAAIPHISTAVIASTPDQIHLDAVESLPTIFPQTKKAIYAFLTKTQTCRAPPAAQFPLRR